MIVDTAPELCHKCDFFFPEFFFPEKRMKGIFVYVLEFMLTLDKMQNTSPLVCTSSKSEVRAFFGKLFKLFILYTQFCRLGVLAQRSGRRLHNIDFI